jgi:DNA-binding XRE family transcriptional regulator
MITAAQCRAARAWLNLTQVELAKLIGRDHSAVSSFENGKMDIVLALALQHVLQERGIEFIDPSPDLCAGILGP